jgi:hypothetical protein
VLAYSNASWRIYFTPTEVPELPPDRA